MANPQEQAAIDAAVDNVYPKSNPENNKATADEITAKVKEQGKAAGASIKPKLEDVGKISDAINKVAKIIDPNQPSDKYADQVIKAALKEPGVDKAVTDISKSDGAWLIAGSIKDGLIKGAKEKIAEDHEKLTAEIDKQQSQETKMAKDQPAKPAPVKTSQTQSVEANKEEAPEAARPMQVAKAEAPKQQAAAASVAPKEVEAPKQEVAAAPAPKVNDKGYFDLAAIINGGIDMAVDAARQIMGDSIKDIEQMAGNVKQGVQMVMNDPPTNVRGNGGGASRQV